MDTAVRHMSQTPRREVLTSQYGPSVAALFYPLALFALHESGKQLLQATYAGGKLAAGVAMGLAVCLVYSVPVLSFAVILRSTADVRSRRLAHLAFASPPMFVLIGVLFYMLGLPNGDYLVWTLGWLGVLAFARVARPVNRMAAPAATWVRFGHGISAALIIAFFLAWHLGNHLTAAWSLDTDKQVMDALRTWYRSSAVQPILIALFAFQLLSGLRLLWAKIARETDIYSAAQTGTGAFLGVYIVTHLIAGFVLGRIFQGVDTTFAWASGAPTGLLLDSWNVRLIPHYSLAVWFVVTHIAVGVRVILIAHRISLIAVNRVAWASCAAGFVLSFVITLAQLSVRS